MLLVIKVDKHKEPSVAHPVYITIRLELDHPLFPQTLFSAIDKEY